MSVRHRPGVHEVIYRQGRAGQKNATALKEIESNEEPLPGAETGTCRTPSCHVSPAKTAFLEHFMWGPPLMRLTNPQSHCSERTGTKDENAEVVNARSQLTEHFRCGTIGWEVLD